MRKSVLFLFITIITAMLSGCIISHSPKEDPVIMSPGVAKTFSIQVFPKPAIYKWYLYDALIPDATGNTYTFTLKEEGSSNFTLNVVAGGDKHTWNIHYHGPSWHNITVPQTVNMNDVWGNSSNDVWIVGDEGTILHWDGSTLSSVASGTTLNLNGIYGTDNNDVWAVGGDVNSDKGYVILHWNGSTWETRNSGSVSGYPQIITHVWSASANDVWFSGGYLDPGQTENGHGIYGHWDGTNFIFNNSSTFGLMNVWGSDANHVWFTGADGCILFWNGSTMSPVNSETIYDLSSIWGSSDSDVWCTGDNGTIIHWDGSTWTPITLMNQTDYDVTGVWGSPNNKYNVNDMWVTGSWGHNQLPIGEITHWDGSDLIISMMLPSSMNSIWGINTFDIWAVGNNGTVLHYY